MCGIAGVFNVRSGAPVDRHALALMSAAQSHRGPDASGMYVDGPLGLAHRRLSIIDLDPRGTQPMATADGRYSIVFNGEIYNYVELRRKLRAAGVAFRTETDTEVLLALFAREGSKSFTRLNGMFAAAVWDAADRSLVLVRDRVGIKPLYVAETPGGIAFASEAKALLECPGVSRDVETTAIPTYMAFGYVPGEATLFRGIRSVPPGQFLRVDAAGTTQTEYWRLDYDVNERRTADDTAAELHDLLLDAARIHMRSDVPVGVFLSGGLDSSATVSLLAEAGIRNIQTFSVAYDAGAAFDETRYARLVANHFGTTHHELYVEPEQFRDFIPGYVWHMDEPVTEAAALSLYFIARLLRQHVTVALSGEGADELFGGYDIYRYMQWIERYRSLPEWVRGVTTPLLAAMPSTKIRKYAALSGAPLEERYLGVSLLPPADLDMYSTDLRASVAAASPARLLSTMYAATAGRDPLTRMLHTDLKAWLVDDLLIKADKMTMASGVELRVPFLDHRVVEYAATIPSRFKIRHGAHKWILKRAFGARLPQATLARKKVGFPTPLQRMFRHDLADYLRDTLLSSSSLGRGYFRRDYIERRIDEHARGDADHHQLLWQLVVLEEWHRRFIDASRTTPDTEGLCVAS